MDARPEDCPHDLSGPSTRYGLRRTRNGEVPTHVSECPRCHTKVYTVRDLTSVR